MEVVLLIFFGILGVTVGSFINVWSLRSLTGKKLGGRSECPNCHHQLSILDLAPLFSYLYLKGKCRYCKKRISIQYPLAEGSALALFLISGYLLLNNFSNSISVQLIFTSLIYLFGIAVLLTVFITDYLAGLIPNRVIIPAILLLLALKIVYLLSLWLVTYFALSHDSEGIGKYLLPPYSNYLYVIIERFGMPIFYDLLAGLGVGLAFFLLVLSTKGRAMGGGDIKLGVFVGLLNGWPLSLVALMLAFSLGAVYSIGLLVAGRKRFGQTVAFGPFLVIGSVLTLFWGQQLFDWYLGLIGRP